jgi:hypothetical protein
MTRIANRLNRLRVSRIAAGAVAGIAATTLAVLVGIADVRAHRHWDSRRVVTVFFAVGWGVLGLAERWRLTRDVYRPGGGEVLRLNDRDVDR